ncbi:VOC family protein [Allorhizocola rhizosphaerae]|uniref:VOC family protein n=1 Tax=Allorhizocola rhizosphaerae TaxID=1872709 RepID=UPI000E3D46A6|nr:VOC family protein [Allorhizocola rhizosphaerae]
MNPRLNAIGIVASDMRASIAFYGRLGLEFKSEGDDSHASCLLPNGLNVMLDAEGLVRDLVPDWTPPVGGHAFALAFEFATPAEVDTKFAELVDAGARAVREPWDAFWGQRYASVRDPDGNGVDLYCPLPRSDM